MQCKFFARVLVNVAVVECHIRCHANACVYVRASSNRHELALKSHLG